MLRLLVAAAFSRAALAFSYLFLLFLLLAPIRPALADPVSPQGVIDTVGLSAAPQSEVFRALPVASAPSAQDEAANDNESGWAGVVSTIRDTAISTMAAVVIAVLTWLAQKVGGWLGTKSALDDVIRDKHMTEYARSAITTAIDYALKKAGATPEQLKDKHFKSAVLESASKFITMQFPEVWKWLDQNNDGVIDYIAAHLPMPAPEAEAA